MSRHGATMIGRKTTAFDPATLFALGEAGVWYDPSDLSTLFTDAAGTTPAGNGNPIGKMLDKSGNGMHATMSGSLRPTLVISGGKSYLQFDGANTELRWSSAPSSTGAKLPSPVLVGFGAKIDTGSVMAWLFGSNISIVGVTQSGSSSGSVFNSGSPTAYVDGSALATQNDRGAFYTALGTSSPHVATFTPSDLSSWGGDLQFGSYPGALYQGRIYGLLITTYTSLRTSVESYLSSKF